MKERLAVKMSECKFIDVITEESVVGFEYYIVTQLYYGEEGDEEEDYNWEDEERKENLFCFYVYENKKVITNDNDLEYECETQIDSFKLSELEGRLKDIIQKYGQILNIKEILNKTDELVKKYGQYSNKSNKKETNSINKKQVEIQNLEIKNRIKFINTNINSFDYKLILKEGKQKEKYDNPFIKRNSIIKESESTQDRLKFDLFIEIFEGNLVQFKKLSEIEINKEELRTIQEISSNFINDLLNKAIEVVNECIITYKIRFDNGDIYHPDYPYIINSIDEIYHKTNYILNQKKYLFLEENTLKRLYETVIKFENLYDEFCDVIGSTKKKRIDFEELNNIILKCKYSDYKTAFKAILTLLKNNALISNDIITIVQLMSKKQWREDYIEFFNEFLKSQNAGFKINYKFEIHNET